MPELSDLRCPRCDTPFHADLVDRDLDLAHCIECDADFCVSTGEPVDDATETGDAERFDVDGSTESPSSESAQGDIDAESTPEESTPSTIPAPVGEVNINLPPAGAWIDNEVGGLLVGAKLRSRGGYVALAIASIWTFLWLGGFFALGIDEDGSIDWSLLLMMIPFELVSLALFPLAIYMTLGHIRVFVTRNESYIYSGVGPIGRKRYFEWDLVSDVVYEAAGVVNGRPTYRVRLIGPEPPVTFGKLLPDDRKAFVAAVLLKNKRRR
jgi:hypothetical protein